MQSASWLCNLQKLEYQIKVNWNVKDIENHSTFPFAMMSRDNSV